MMPFKPKNHRPRGAISEQQRVAAYDECRQTAAQRGYDARWRKLRAAVLAEHPLCVECLKHDRTMPANEVDHIIPHKGNKDLFYDRTNLQALCKPCHSSKTAREDSSFAGPIRKR